jgi:hypothetical protein
MELTRQVLIFAVESGTMSHGQTRAEAKRLGLRPLEGSADLDGLDDPALMPFWTPPMALARIVFRDLECVRLFEPGYRAENGRWIEHKMPSGTTAVLTPTPPASLDMVGIHADGHTDDDRPLAMTYLEPLDALWVAIRCGAPDTTGIDRDSHQCVTIPDHFWYEAPLSGDWGDEVTFGARGGYQTLRKVRLSRPHLLGVWQPRLMTR